MGPAITPPNVMNPDAPVTAAAAPGGARRASSESCTPFHPMAEKPYSAATGNTAHSCQAGPAPASAAPETQATAAIAARTRVADRVWSATAPQAIRPKTAATVAQVSANPDATSDHRNDSVR